MIDDIMEFTCYLEDLENMSLSELLELFTVELSSYSALTDFCENVEDYELALLTMIAMQLNLSYRASQIFQTHDKL